MMDSASLLGAAINEEAAYFPAGANLSPYKLVIVSILSVAVILCCDAICIIIGLLGLRSHRKTTSEAFICEFVSKCYIFVT